MANNCFGRQLGCRNKEPFSEVLRICSLVCHDRSFGVHPVSLSRRDTAKAFLQERMKVVVCHLRLTRWKEGVPISVAEQY